MMNASEQIESILARSNKQNIADHYVEMAHVLSNATVQATVDKEVVKAKATMQAKAMPIAYHHDLQPEIGALLDLLI